MDRWGNTSQPIHNTGRRPEQMETHNTLQGKGQNELSYQSQGMFGVFTRGQRENQIKCLLT